jgi:hypothetical protein
MEGAQATQLGNQLRPTQNPTRDVVASHPVGQDIRCSYSAQNSITILQKKPLLNVDLEPPVSPQHINSDSLVYAVFPRLSVAHLQVYYNQMSSLGFCSNTHLIDWQMDFNPHVKQNVIYLFIFSLFNDTF